MDSRFDPFLHGDYRGHDANYREGVTHGTYFVTRTVKQLIKQGATVEQINQAVSDLAEAIVDWRNDIVELPKGQPWEWSADEMEKFIDRRRVA